MTQNTDKVVDKQQLISGTTKIKDDDHVKREGALILDRLSKVVKLKGIENLGIIRDEIEQSSSSSGHQGEAHRLNNTTGKKHGVPKKGQFALDQLKFNQP